MDKWMRYSKGQLAPLTTSRPDNSNNNSNTTKVTTKIDRSRRRCCRWRRLVRWSSIIVASIWLLAAAYLVANVPIDLDLNQLSAEAEAQAEAEAATAVNQINPSPFNPQEQVQEQEQEQNIKLASQTSGIEEILAEPEAGHAPDYQTQTLTSSGRTASGRLRLGSMSRSSWEQRMRDRASKAWQTVRTKLPEYFNFDMFRESFQRSYEPNEMLYRKSRFLSRCIEILKARVNFRLGKITHRVEVNKFSDRSPNELKRMYMSAPPIEMINKSERDQETYLKEMKRERAIRDEWDAELLSETSLYPYGDQIRDDDESGDELTIISELQAEKQIELMLAQAGLDFEARQAIKSEISGAAIETASQSAIMGTGSELPWPGQLKSDDSVPIELSAAELMKPYVAPQLAPEQALDWSLHECFHQIYNQGTSCGNCYVMAATTLAEFYKCTELGPQKVVQRKFSKEYVMDCAQKYSPAVLGCMGGSILDTLRFISEAGVFKIRNWRERRKIGLIEAQKSGDSMLSTGDKCPLNPFTVPVNKWGEIRVEFNPKQVHPNDWLEALQDGPLVVSVQMPPEAVSFSGGVHSGSKCSGTNNWHAMVLVGYGVDLERGIPYWRFRNSWGPDWGDKGHFNLAMSVSSDCLVGGVRVYREPLSPRP